VEADLKPGGSGSALSEFNSEGSTARLRSLARHDTLWISLSTTAFFLLAIYTDTFAGLFGFLLETLGSKADKLAAFLFVIPVALLAYAIRRLQDTRKALTQLQSAETSYRAVFDTCPVSVILFDPKTHLVIDANEQACRDLGYTRSELTQLSISDFDALGDPGAIRVRGRKHAKQQDVQEFEAKHRTKSGEIRDVLVRVQGVRIGTRDLSFGAQIDITERKKAEASRQLLVREVDHRARNLLTIVQAALRLTPKHDAAAFARSIEMRVMALARVHNLLAKGQWQGVRMEQMLQGEFSAFSSLDGASRVVLAGPAIIIPPTLTQPLSMVVHELATNSIKYGALSVPEGRVSMHWDVRNGSLSFEWTEAGGPTISGPPAGRGFGSRLLELTIRSQMRGSFERVWNPEGLTFQMTIRFNDDRQSLAA
jgi:PAS domain S-box-containing protein